MINIMQSTNVQVCICKPNNAEPNPGSPGSICNSIWRNDANEVNTAAKSEYE